MKIKIVGFKVGDPGITANKQRTIPPRKDVPPVDVAREEAALRIGYCIIDCIDGGADFISIRRVDE